MHRWVWCLYHRVVCECYAGPVNWRDCWGGDRFRISWHNADTVMFTAWWRCTGSSKSCICCVAVAYICCFFTAVLACVWQDICWIARCVFGARCCLKFYELSHDINTYASPSAWNSLPKDLRAVTDPGLFRKRLKTHFFSLAFCVCWQFGWLCNAPRWSRIVVGAL